eukprot:TRINITY_DN6327_c0_g1_i1.p1 TRINITY_DN6327_c0_g1~~TRINITY_DN6327_c0_g1_i1.p1  ORF type:complete len:170 (+),score=27.70 TRINITY_DN6327_c0_g1_i1:393-902(+)
MKDFFAFDVVAHPDDKTLSSIPSFLPTPAYFKKLQAGTLLDEEDELQMVVGCNRWKCNICGRSGHREDNHMHFKNLARVASPNIVKMEEGDLPKTRAVRTILNDSFMTIEQRGRCRECWRCTGLNCAQGRKDLLGYELVGALKHITSSQHRQSLDALEPPQKKPKYSNE